MFIDKKRRKRIFQSEKSHIVDDTSDTSPALPAKKLEASLLGNTIESASFCDAVALVNPCEASLTDRLDGINTNPPNRNPPEWKEKGEKRLAPIISNLNKRDNNKKKNI